MNKYTAVGVSIDTQNDTKSGFKTKDEAWEYIKDNFLCEICIRGLEMKPGDDDYDEDEDCFNVGDTRCGCEWLVMTDKQYNEAETYDDLMSAGGWKQVV